MSDSTASLARSSAAMAAGTVVSRVLGMVRTSMQTAVVGAAVLGAEAWDVANTLPNIIFLLLAGGVLNAVLVPQITRASSHPDGGQEYVDRLLTLAITALVTITVVFTAGAGLMVHVYGSNRWPSGVFALSTAFALICMPQVFFYGLYTLLGQVLNARGQFASYMWAPVVANIVAIAGLAVFWMKYPLQAPVAQWTPAMVWLLAGTATLGVVAQALVLIWPLHRAGFRYRPRWGFRGVGLRSASRVAMWTFAALAVSQLAFIVTSQVLTRAVALANQSGVHAPGKYSYSQAFLLFMLPHSLVTVSLVTALFTRLSKAAHAGDLPEVRDDIRRGMRLTAVATVPSTVGIFVLGNAATAVLFFRNSTADTSGIASVTMAMMAGLVPFGLLYLLQRVFYAFEDARTPFLLQVIVSVVATIANLISATLPVQWMAVGVGAGQTLSNLAGAAVGVVLVRRRLGSLELGDVVRVYARLGAAALAAAAVAVLVQLVAGHVVAGRTADLVSLLAGGAAFLVVYLAMARVMRVREIEDLFGPLLGRARRFLPGR